MSKRLFLKLNQNFLSKAQLKLFPQNQTLIELKLFTDKSGVSAVPAGWFYIVGGDGLSTQCKQIEHFCQSTRIFIW